MIRSVVLFLLVSAPVSAQEPARGAASATADQTFYSVSYVEVKPSGRATAVQALKQYQDALRINTASLRTELFEQVDRPGHLLLVETWQSQSAFDNGTPALRKRLTDAIEPVRVSGWDQRPYKTLSVASGAAEPTGRRCSSSPTWTSRPIRRSPGC